MKLIDILVQELPKRGGWPSEATKLHQDYDGEVWMHLIDDDVRLVFRLDQAATNARQPAKSLTKENIVTREQYEAALQQPAWNGEGLPPVDLLCEWYDDNSGWVQGYLRAKINSESSELLIIEPAGTCAVVWRGVSTKFRPVRSERDEAIQQIAELMHCGSFRADAACVYDAIARGDIPGIKLSD